MYCNFYLHSCQHKCQYQYTFYSQFYSLLYSYMPAHKRKYLNSNSRIKACRHVWEDQLLLSKIYKWTNVIWVTVCGSSDLDNGFMGEWQESDSNWIKPHVTAVLNWSAFLYAHKNLMTGSEHNRNWLIHLIIADNGVIAWEMFSHIRSLNINWACF